MCAAYFWCDTDVLVVVAAAGAATFASAATAADAAAGAAAAATAAVLLILQPSLSHSATDAVSHFPTRSLLPLRPSSPHGVWMHARCVRPHPPPLFFSSFFSFVT